MRAPDPKAIAYEVRTRKAAMFRRCGFDFTRENMRIPASALNQAKRDLLMNSDPDLEVTEILEGAVVMPKQDGLGAVEVVEEAQMGELVSSAPAPEDPTVPVDVPAIRRRRRGR